MANIRYIMTEIESTKFLEILKVIAFTFIIVIGLHGVQFGL